MLRVALFCQLKQNGCVSCDVIIFFRVYKFNMQVLTRRFIAVLKLQSEEFTTLWRQTFSCGAAENVYTPYRNNPTKTVFSRRTCTVDGTRPSGLPYRSSWVWDQLNLGPLYQHHFLTSHRVKHCESEFPQGPICGSDITLPLISLFLQPSPCVHDGCYHSRTDSDPSSSQAYRDHDGA